MTVFEKLQGMTEEEFAQWYFDHCTQDKDPAIRWWEETYCEKCEPVIGRYEDSYRDIKFAYCEVYDRCRFFEGDVPDLLQMVKLWLKSDA